jgi:hypothetical protein
MLPTDFHNVCLFPLLLLMMIPDLFSLSFYVELLLCHFCEVNFFSISPNSSCLWVMKLIVFDVKPSAQR